MEVPVLFEDKHIIVCVKPSGMPSQGDRRSSMDMVSYLKNYIKQKGCQGEPYVGLIHRLDQPVSGVMVFAKTPEAAKSLSRQIQNNQMKKEYLAVLSGTLDPKEKVLMDYLLKDGRTNTSSVVEKGTTGSKLAELSYKILRTKEVDEKCYSLAAISLKSGRHHQIRVQMAHAGAPLFGDTKYNTEYAIKGGWHHLGLCAHKLSFKHPVTQKGMTFEYTPKAEPFSFF